MAYQGNKIAKPPLRTALTIALCCTVIYTLAAWLAALSINLMGTRLPNPINWRALNHTNVLSFGGEKIADMQLPLEHRKNIYLIFKESVNNAVNMSMPNTLG